jgi:hypothetical protein
MLKNIYRSLNIQKKAKAKDLKRFIGVKEKQLTTPGTGKREKYYKIIG